ncbi:MAG: trypsin-like serine protease, partial [Thermoanaerobaculia bacterium]|nr:trypsin-like serine protease [Thermoanaerobaculia bacterium]
TAPAPLLFDGGGRFALTAAHCVYDVGAAFSVTGVNVTFTTGNGTFKRFVPPPMIHIHPLYTGVFEGYDIAILEMDPPLPPEVPRYGLFRGDLLSGGDPTPDGAEIGPIQVHFGFGKTGNGTRGCLPARRRQTLRHQPLGIAGPRRPRRRRCQCQRPTVDLRFRQQGIWQHILGRIRIPLWLWKPPFRQRHLRRSHGDGLRF